MEMFYSGHHLHVTKGSFFCLNSILSKNRWKHSTLEKKFLVCVCGSGWRIETYNMSSETD